MGAMGGHDELCYLSATEAMARFADRSLSPVELLDALVARAEVTEPTVNALTSRRLDHAYAAARESEARWAAGDARQLEGVTVAFKEEQPIAGEPWQLGSRIHEHEIASITHPLYERLTGLGAVVHARTATPEFSCAPFTHSDLWGVTRNPWNPAVSPGGSSGGSGAALATGVTTLATGSDIGGSIRIPASLCGVVGFKPPWARVPTLPPFNLDRYSHDGPMGRTVGDVALLQNAMAGKHPADHVSMPDPPVIPLVAGSIAGMRVAVTATLGNYPVDAAVRANTLAFAEVLRSAGAEVVPVDVAIDAVHAVRTANIHYASIFASYIARTDAAHPGLATDYAVGSSRRIAGLLDEYGVFDGVVGESEIQMAIAAAMDGFDALVCPSIGSIGWEAGNPYLDERLEVDGQPIPSLLTACQTIPFNIASAHPVLAVPSGVAANGVPTGVQIVGHTYDDATPFRLAAAVEREVGWWGDPAWRPGR